MYEPNRTGRVSTVLIVCVILWCISVVSGTVLRRVRVNPRNAGMEFAGAERGMPAPTPPLTHWRASLFHTPRKSAETRGITRKPVKHSHMFGREFQSVQNLGSTIE